MRIRKLLAVSTALAIAALGTSAVAADAAAGHNSNAAHGQTTKGDHGHAKGHAKGHGSSDDTSDSSDDSDSSAASGKGHGQDHSDNGNHGQGNNGNHGQGNNGNGGSNGNGGGKGSNGGDHNPAGNNGTIKVDNAPFDDAPNNEPHVSCTFQIDFYGFDEGDLNADVLFEAHAPTLSPSGSNTLLTDTVFIGEDDASGGGSEAGLDASKTYTLDFGDITPHPKQGYHVKLTIHADGSQGADTKHKVFWVQPCEDTSSTGGETPGTGGETPGTEAPGTPGGTDTQVEGEQATSSGNSDSAQASVNGTQVAGVQATAGNKNLPTQVDAGGNVLDFVTSPVPLMLIALGLALGIFGLTRRSRRA